MLNVIYTIKCCMLLMYTRLTLGTQIQKMVKYLAVYVLIGWISTEIAFFTACRPFAGYWAMPPPNPQCTTLQHYAIVQACFNISSDTLMLFIPIPLVTKLNMPWKQKGVLLIIFSMGTFVILAAILTKVFNLSNIWDPSYMLWYTREASVAVYVSNLPMIWPLLREWFPVLRSMTPGQKSSTNANGGSVLGTGLGGRPRTTNIAGRHLSGGFGGKRLSDHGITTTIKGKGESTEELSGSDDTELGNVSRRDSWEERPVTGHGGEGLGLRGWESDTNDKGIHLTTVVQVSEEHVTQAGIGHTAGITSPTRDVEKGFEWGFHGKK
jgi:Fungal rhodopsin domain